MSNNLTLLLLCLFSYALDAQPDSIPAKVYMETNNIKALINANGLLFYDYEKGGQFLPDSTSRSPIKAAGIWLGGVDPGGNLKLAAQLYNEDGKQDFVPGFSSNVPGEWNQIWRTSKVDILAHLTDYYQDFEIDDTLSSIFGWPAYGNKYFKEYHGFELPELPDQLAAFWDEDHSGTYDPDKGEFPLVSNGRCDGAFFFNIPDEIYWHVFHDNTPHTQTQNSHPIWMDISHTVFSYHCTNNKILDNTVFSNYLLTNGNLDGIDSCFMGLFLDFELGCPDDYLGVIPEQNILYAYNSDDDDSCPDHQGYGVYPPSAAVKLIRGPLSEFRQEMDLFAAVPLYENPPNPGMGFPENAQDFYNYLTGTWKDGTPVTSGGNGYDPQSTNYQSIAYPGHPDDPGSWSEVSAGSIPGSRKVVTSYGPFKLLPGAVNEIMVGYSFMPNGEFPVTDHLVDVYAGIDHVMQIFDNCFGGTPLPCSSDVITDPSPIETSTEPIVFIPNPATSNVRAKFEKDYIQTFAVYDALGRLMYQSTVFGSSHYFNVSDWPSGVYYGIARAGHETYIEPLVVVGIK
ncbi:MAG: T9SS type A sorting domain-containing protein [Bacteroidota bacterium]